MQELQAWGEGGAWGGGALQAGKRVGTLAARLQSSACSVPSSRNHLPSGQQTCGPPPGLSPSLGQTAIIPSSQFICPPPSAGPDSAATLLWDPGTQAPRGPWRAPETGLPRPGGCSPLSCEPQERPPPEFLLGGAGPCTGFSPSRGRGRGGGIGFPQARPPQLAQVGRRSGNQEGALSCLRITRGAPAPSACRLSGPETCCQRCMNTEDRYAEQT